MGTVHAVCLSEPHAIGMSGPYTVALTGGIGSGKSTVADIFADLGVPVIDSDIIAREIVEPGKPAYNEILEVFGCAILDDNRKLDRQKLADIVFKDKSKKNTLENILHPEVYDEIDRQITAINFPYCIVVIPLLVETESTNRYSRVLLVDVPESVQLQRTTRRDNRSLEMIEKIIASQAGREQRQRHANDTIDNTESLKQLQQSVMKLHEKYLRLSTEK